MNRMMDLVVRVGLEQCSIGLCLREDWLVRRDIALDSSELLTARSLQKRCLYQELQAFLRKGRMLFDSIGKIVVVTDIADRFEASITHEPKRIGYIRIAQDSYEPEYMVQLLEKHGGVLITEYLRPGDVFDRDRCASVLHRFASAGVRDIAVHSMYQLEASDEELRIIEVCERTAPGRFRYHTLETWEYTSLLLTENRLLVNVCIKELFERELREIERACLEHGAAAPLVVLDGAGFCIDKHAALQDPLATWQGGHAAAMMGAAALFSIPEAVVISPYAKRVGSDNDGTHPCGVVIDRTREYRPVTMGRTKRFYGFQVAGPFPGAIEFAEVPHRHRLLESIRSVSTAPGPLPILDMTGGAVDLQDLDHLVYRVSDRDSALLGGAQSAEFRKDFHCMTAPSEESDLVQDSLRTEALRWLDASGLRLSDVKESFSLSKARYLKTERERMTLRITGRIGSELHKREMD